MRQLKTQPISVENGGLIQIAYCEMRFEKTADWNHAETLNEGKALHQLRFCTSLSRNRWLNPIGNSKLFPSPISVIVLRRPS